MYTGTFFLIYIHICILTYNFDIHVDVYGYILFDIHTHMYFDLHTYTYVYEYILRIYMYIKVVDQNTYVSTYVFDFIYIHICIRVYTMYIHAYVYMCVYASTSRCSTCT